MAEPKRVAVIAGAGPGNGQGLARRFARAGHPVALLARDKTRVDTLAGEIDGARGYACDVADADAVAKAFAEIRAAQGEIGALLYNAGSGFFADVEAVTPEQFEQSWRVNAFGALICAKQVMPDMIKRGEGEIIFIGATASRRGGARAAAFAPAKAAQRSLAESMARQLWPKGVHVALIIVDGVVDMPLGRRYFPDRPDAAFIAPDALAEIAYTLTQQDRRAWSFEVEARPAIEPW